MENREFFKKPLHVFLLAMLCCTLWGSAAPFIKWGYKLFNIEGVPSILMFAGIRFTLAGFLVILFGSFLQKKVLVAKKENIQGICTLALFQTAGQYFSIILDFHIHQESTDPLFQEPVPLYLC